MQGEYLPKELIARLRTAAIQQHLDAAGWQRTERVKGQYSLYRRPESESLEVLVPKGNDFADFTRRIIETLTIVAEYEKRSPVSLLNDLLLPPSDIIRYKLEDADVDDGTIRLRQSLSLLSGCQKMLKASATSVVAPQSLLKRKRVSETSLDDCRLGQTERGSFIVSIICPLSPVVDSRAMRQERVFTHEVDHDFMRRVTETLVRSTASVVKCVQEGNIAIVQDPSPGCPPVSHEFCEALLEAQSTDGQATLVVQPQWARGTRPPHSMPTEVQVRHDYIGAIKSIANALRPKEPPLCRKFAGRITSLSGHPGADEKMEGKVILSFQHDRGELLRAELNLSADEYAVACDAHKQNALVALSGVFVRGNQLHSIEQVADFQRLPLTGTMYRE